MPVANRLSLEPAPVAGVRLGIAEAGIKQPGRKDLVVMGFDPGTTVSAVFTRNRFRAAPVIVAERHLAASAPRAVLVNTGYANAGTGPEGERDALACCQALAEAAGIPTEAVLPFSTGVIGETLPVDRVRGGIAQAMAHLTEDAWLSAAEGIMTTDTRPKAESVRFESNGQVFTVTGIAKGAGMLRPNMATMLAFVATDAELPQASLDTALERSVGLSFNRISVDGDTSTNDACLLAATGASGARPDTQDFQQALDRLLLMLAQGLVRDAEGASRFVGVRVRGGLSEAECATVAFTVAESPLVKTALFAGDPNWGRILAAVGRAGLDDLDVAGVDIYLGEQRIVANGVRAADYDESRAAAYMTGEDIDIVIDLGRGADAEATVWTSDFSYDYVRINAEYRS